MIGSLVRAMGNKAGLLFLVIGLAIAAIAAAQEPPNSAAPDRSGGIAASRAEMFWLDLSLERRPIPRWTAEGLRRSAQAHESRLDRGGLGRPSRRHGYENQFAGGWQMLHPRPAIRGPGPDGRLSSQPARSRRTDHEDRQGGRPDRPLELLADRHAPEGGRLHRRRVRQGGRWDLDRRQPGQRDLRPHRHRRGLRRRCPRPGRIETDRGVQRLRPRLGSVFHEEHGPVARSTGRSGSAR